MLAMATAPGYEDALDVFARRRRARRRGWFHDRQKPPDSLHSTVSAGNAPVIDDYLADLRRVRRRGAGDAPPTAPRTTPRSSELVDALGSVRGD